MREFSGFIEDCNLIDIPCSGNKFIGFSIEKKSMSKIDHFLLSDALIDSWGVVGKLIYKRDISYHFRFVFPIIRGP